MIRITTRWLAPLMAFALTACADDFTAPEAKAPWASNSVVASNTSITLRPALLASFGVVNLSGVSGDAAPSFGTGSVRGASTVAGQATQITLLPANLFGRGITLGEIARISYWTKTGSTHAADARDWAFSIYTKPFPGDLSTPTWYGGRFGAEPYFSRDISDPANTWNNWTTDGAANQLRFFESTAGAPGANFGSYTDPDWDTFKNGNHLGTSVSRSSQEVLDLRVSTGTGWANGFTGQLDGIRIELTDGSTATIDLEANLPACTATCYVDAATGNDALSGAAPDDAKKTIQAAVNQVSVAGTVIVAAGTYLTNPNLDKALSLLGANSGVAGNGSRGAESVIQGRATVNASNVRIDGFRFDGAGTNPAGIVNGIAGFASLTIENNVLTGYTGRAVTFGFAEGAALAATPASNITVRRNTFEAMAGDNATSLVIFNTNGVVVEDNVIRNDDVARIGRRGINLDGVRDARVEGNDVQNGRTDFSNSGAASTAAPWAVQLSMSDRSTERVTIENNSIGGALYGIVGLSQRNLIDVTITGNTLDNVWNAVALNSGTAVPAAGTAMSNLTVSRNVVRAYQHGVRLRNLHAPTSPVLPNGMPVSFANVTVTRNWLQPLAGGLNANVNGIFIEDVANITIDGGTTGTVAGSCNFWNDASGPGPVGPGSGSLVTARVDFSGWLISSNLDAACPPPDTEAPVVSNVAVTPNPAAYGTPVTLTAYATDNVGVTAASYSVNGVATGSFTFGPGTPVTLSVSLGTPAVGVYEICVTATDAANNPSNIECTMLAVYDPSAGFVTGGGWFMSPAGAYVADAGLTGKATFGFVSKYVKGKTLPTGNTEFQFKAGNLNFSSSAYEWLVVNQGGTNAQFKGTGALNGVPGYKFMVWAKDDTPDTFRIQIEDGAGTVVYDNKQDSSFGTALGGGSIVIHVPKK